MLTVAIQNNSFLIAKPCKGIQHVEALDAHGRNIRTLTPLGCANL